MVGEFTTHFRTYFSAWIGMFNGGTIWILTLAIRCVAFLRRKVALSSFFFFFEVPGFIVALKGWSKGKLQGNQRDTKGKAEDSIETKPTPVANRSLGLSYETHNSQSQKKGQMWMDSQRTTAKPSASGTADGRAPFRTN